METKPTAELKRVRQWAKEKIDAGSEPPWAWYQYMKLIESVDSVLDGIDATTTENSQLSATRSDVRLQLVGSKNRQGTSQRRPSRQKVQMPM
jgi:hypothetical protein